MRIQDHVEKARRIEATMTKKLDRDGDYELVLEGYMLAGTHLLNAILHKLTVTREDFDLLHSNKPVLETPIEARLQPFFEAMRYIEDLRPGYLRGLKPWRVEDGRGCAESYEKVKRFAAQVLG
ncbi:MAG TPA: hypothetical protein VKF40_15795 [Burkholderiales bacterium]|nr:hypothetical protein [Burkholderiales bacterium]